MAEPDEVPDRHASPAAMVGGYAGILGKKSIDCNQRQPLRRLNGMGPVARHKNNPVDFATGELRDTVSLFGDFVERGHEDYVVIVRCGRALGALDQSGEERIIQVRDYDANQAACLASHAASERIGPIAELFNNSFDPRSYFSRHGGMIVEHA
jgi:hypothetical protein